MNKQRHFIGVCVCVVLLTLSFAVAAENAAADGKAMTAKVISVRGLAKKMQADKENSPWTPVKVNDQLTQYSVIRTGLNSQVVIDFADRGLVTVDSGTKVGISKFISIEGAGARITANVGLKYGSMRLKVDRTHGVSDFSVSTAVATLSVHGTDGQIAFSGDQGLFLRGAEGTFAVVRGVRSRMVAANQRVDGNLSRSTDLKNQERDTVVGDTSGGLTEDEKVNLADFGTGRGVIGYVGNPIATETEPTQDDPEGHHH